MTNVDCSDPYNFLNPVCVADSIPANWESCPRVPNTWQLKDGIQEKTYLGHMQRYPFMQVRKHYDSAQGKQIGFEVEVVEYHAQRSIGLTDTELEAITFAKNAMKLDESKIADWVFGERCEVAFAGKTIDLRKRR